MKHVASFEHPLYLITPKSLLKGFKFEEDREYFSKPVRVEVIASGLDLRMLKRAPHVYVKDPVRGHTYPVMREDLKIECLLTSKQKAAAGVK